MNYTWRDEMVGDGIENCIKAVHNFNPEKSNNPFAYFTQIAFNAYRRKIKEEKKENYIKHKNLVMLMLQYDDGFDIVSNEFNEVSNETISDFESKLTVKKAAAKKKPKTANTSEDIAALIFANVIASNVMISNTS